MERVETMETMETIETTPILEKYIPKKAYWIFNENSYPCTCCSPVSAMNDNYWECSYSWARWRILDEEPDFSKPHDLELCMGKCSYHPLITSYILPLIHPELYDTTWGDYSSEFEQAYLALETAIQKCERLRREADEAEKKRIEAETHVRFLYSREMHDKSLRGVKRNEAPKKFDRPCKWMVGKDKEDSLAKGETPCCWAWEFKNPKTGKMERPRSCMYQHPSEHGWRKEWNTDPTWSSPIPLHTNNRFANLLIHKR